MIKIIRIIEIAALVTILSFFLSGITEMAFGQRSTISPLSQWKSGGGGALIIPRNASDTVVIGGSATTTADVIFEVIGSSSLDRLEAGTTTFLGLVTIDTRLSSTEIVANSSTIGTSTFTGDVTIDTGAPTSSIFFGTSTTPGCLVWGDKDAGGVSYVTVLNSRLRISTSSCL